MTEHIESHTPSLEPQKPDELSMQHFMRTSADVAKGSLLITGFDSPTARHLRQPIGTAPVSEQILEALDRGDDETARAIHKQYPEQPKKI